MALLGEVLGRAPQDEVPLVVSCSFRAASARPARDRVRHRPGSARDRRRARADAFAGRSGQDVHGARGSRWRGLELGPAADRARALPARDRGRARVSHEVAPRRSATGVARGCHARGHRESFQTPSRGRAPRLHALGGSGSRRSNRLRRRSRRPHRASPRGFSSHPADARADGGERLRGSLFARDRRSRAQAGRRPDPGTQVGGRRPTSTAVNRTT